MSKEMEEIGFANLIDAPKEILGQPLTLLHWAGATERVVFATVDEAFAAMTRGWTRYRLAPPAKQQTQKDAA